MPIDLGRAVGLGVARGVTTGRSAWLDTPGCGVPRGGTHGGSNAPEAIFRWEAPATGIYTFDTAGSQYDTLLYARLGGCMGAELGCNDDVSMMPSITTSRLSFSVGAGEQIVLVVDGFDNASGAFQLNITAGAPLADAGVVDVGTPRDVSNACSATDLGGATGLNVFQGTTAGRTARLSVPGCGMETGATSGGSTSPEMVFAWTAPTTDTYTFDTVGSAFDTLLYLRQGDCVGADIACNDDIDTAMRVTTSRITRSLVAGQQIAIIVDGFGGESGPFSLSIARGGGTLDAGTPTCPSGLSYCGGRCVDTSNDAANCGGCGLACASGQSCSSRRCENTPPPRWTIFVYGHGDHNLSPSLLADIEEMSRANLGSSVQLVLLTDWNAYTAMRSRQIEQWNRVMPFGTIGSGNRFPSGLLWLRVPGGGARLQLIRTDVERNLDDPSVLTNAVAEAITRYPSDRYGVVMWDHGGGWGDGFGGDVQDGDPRLGSTTQLNIGVVASALANGAQRAGLLSPRPFQFVAFDTCLLGTGEVASSLQSISNVLLAEAEIDFGDGWDYVGALSWLGSNPRATVQQFAREEIRLWSIHHRNATVTDALFRSKVAIDLTQWSSFEAAMNSLSSILISGGVMSAESLARATYLARPNYGTEQVGEGGTSGGALRDLGQFLIGISNATSAPPFLRSAATWAAESMRRTIIASDQGTFRGMFGQMGIQIAAPEAIEYSSELDRQYRSLAFSWANATRWSEVLAATRPPTSLLPQITRTSANLSNPTRSAPPRIVFSATGAVVEAEVQLARRDSTFIGTGGRWITYGPVLQGVIASGSTYTATWTGTTYSLMNATGVGQSVTTRWYLKAFHPTTQAADGMMSVPGVCNLDGYFGCDLVFRVSDGYVDVVVVHPDHTAPFAMSYREFVDLYSGVSFVPYLPAESNAGDFMSPVVGSPVPLGTTPPRVGVTTAPAGQYELELSIRDVYGRVSRAREYVTVTAPFFP